MTISYRQHEARSLLFVPADDERKMKRAMLCGADAVIFDLEDSILPEKKSRARNNCTTNAFSTSDMPFRLVRINPPGTEWFEDDLKALSEIRPDGVVLPKCETVDGVRAVANAFKAHTWKQRLGLYLTIESPLGLLRAEQIATASDHVVAMAFGAEDFCATTGIDRTTGEPELAHARCTLVTVAKALNLAAIDSPTLVLDNVEDVRADAVRARRLGFTGKFAIHPYQVLILNMAFNPSAEQVQLAREMLEKAEGRSAFRWNGRMVDEAVLRRARQTVEIAKRLETGDL